MKPYHWIVIVLIVILLAYFLIFRKEVKITKLLSFEYSYTNGTYMDSDIKYKLKIEDEKYIAYFKPAGVPQEETKRIEVGEDFARQIEEALIECKVGAWNGFGKSNKHVLDGDSFTLSVGLEGNDGIYAWGYMSYPKNYRAFSEKISNIYSNVFGSVEEYN